MGTYIYIYIYIYKSKSECKQIRIHMVNVVVPTINICFDIRI